MADRGWTYSPARRRWELCGQEGAILAAVPLPVCSEPGLLAELNGYGARRGWPELVPGATWLLCVLEDGPQAGRWEYLDPARYGDPPEDLPVCWADPDDPAEIVHQAVYRRQIQVCGHGRGCGYPYRHDRGLW